MQFYLKIQHFKNGVFNSSGTTVYDASTLEEALRVATKMLEEHANEMLREAPDPENEKRVTIGPVLAYTG